MSLNYKLLIPLLDSNLTKEDLSSEAGFVEAYSHNINKPWLLSQIFLLYEDKDTKDSHMRMVHFQENEYVHSVEFVKIDSKPYTIYTMSIPNKSLLKILSNSFILTDEQKIKIGLFWMFSDIEINSYLTNPLYTMKPFENKSLPEIDFTGGDIWFDEQADSSIEGPACLFLNNKYQAIQNTLVFNMISLDLSLSLNLSLNPDLNQKEIHSYQVYLY